MAFKPGEEEYEFAIDNLNDLKFNQERFIKEVNLSADGHLAYMVRLGRGLDNHFLALSALANSLT